MNTDETAKEIAERAAKRWAEAEKELRNYSGEQFRAKFREVLQLELQAIIRDLCDVTIREAVKGVIQREQRYGGLLDKAT